MRKIFSSYSLIILIKKIQNEYNIDLNMIYLYFKYKTLDRSRTDQTIIKIPVKFAYNIACKLGKQEDTTSLALR